MVCFDMSNWLLCEELALKTTVDHYLSFQISYNDKWKDYNAFGSGKSHVEGKCHEVMSLCSAHVILHVPLHFAVIVSQYMHQVHQTCFVRVLTGLGG